ncbi:CapA family protein [Paenibacillus piscarius]|uniref:CapA family protein n=1 Tax=Paenibacillus piscarius TaxID=1089681 RepID=UPI001EE92469|nr:CapA family protein [Paenibacillus piscarius]
MYPPRSGSRQGKKHSSRRRRRRAWAWLNAALLLMITAALAYSFMDDRDQKNAAPPPAATEAPPSPEADAGAVPDAEQSPGAEASEAPEPATPEPAPAETPAAQPTPEATMEAAAAPASTEQATVTPAAEATATPAAAGNTGGLVSGLPENTTGKTVKLSFAGDIIFSGKAGALLEQKGYDYSYSALDGMFKKDDLTIVNLETPITTRGVGAKNKQFVFKGPPKALDALKAAGIDAVNLANNHTLDQGEEGLLDTLKHLNDRGIPHVGAGKNSQEAYSAQYFERKGMKIALLGFTRVMPVIEWKAEAGKPGLASVYDSAEALKAIAAAKQKADLVVVVVHWGRERMEQYDKTQQALGRSFIDAGADLVMGGHPHVLQGIEPYRGKWIAYSTGNFIFTRGSVPATWETAVFQAECSKQGQCSLTLKPMDAELAQPVPMNEADAQLLLHRMQSISSGLVRVRNDGTVVQAVK